MEANHLCQYLDWDSNFFGRRIARVTLSRLTHGTVLSIMDWARSHNIDCFYFLADANDEDTVRLAEEHGFHLVDIRVTLERQLEPILAERDRTLQGVIRLSKPDDIPVLQAIARASYHDTRFYYDSNFPSPLCDALYETWIEKSCNGFANAVFVAEIKGQIAGYISCHVLEERRGQFGLVGVSTDFRGNRLGQDLIGASLRWFAQHDVARVAVVTQGRNAQAQRMYQRCGFLISSQQLWYHRWFPS